MITIDIVHEYSDQSEKPLYRNPHPAVTPGVVDPIYNIALGRQETLIRAAHQARLAKKAATQPQADRTEQMPVDVQRFGENPVKTQTLFERYTRRIAGLVSRS